MKSVCVLILNYMSYQDTLRYVDNLKDQKGVRLQILIVDNCSPNESFDELSGAFTNDKQVDVIQSPINGGYAYGNNFGLHFLSEKDVDFILISNNDIYLDDDYLISRMTNEYEKQVKPAFIAPLMLVNSREDRKHQAWRLPSFTDDLFASLRTLYYMAKWLGISNRYNFPEEDRRTHRVDCLNGSFFMGEKDVFYLIGLFDEGTFLYVEESILGQNVKRHGLNNYLMRSVHFHHDQGKTTRVYIPKLNCKDIG